MPTEPSILPEPVIRPVRISPAVRLRNYLLAGILVTAPISITVYVTGSVIRWVDKAFTRILPPDYNPNTYLPFSVPGLGLVMLVIGLVLIGFLTANFLGRSLVRIGEAVLSRMPFIRSVYSAVKQIFETVLKDKSTAFREVVLLEFPRSGTWTLGLVIGRTEGEIQEKLPEDLLSVYVPTAPNPTSGYLLFIPRTDAIHLEMSVQDAVKMIVSGGLVTPPRKLA